MKPQHCDELAFLITDLSGGGAERVLLQLATSLRQGPASPRLFLFEDHRDYPFDGEVQILDIPLFKQMSRPRRLLEMTRGLQRLHRAKKTYPLQTCISFLTWPNLYNILTRGQEQVIISVRNNPSLAIRGRMAPIIKALIRRLYPKADHIVAISQDVRRDLIINFQIPADRITTIYNPIDLDTVQAKSRASLPEYLRDLPQYDAIITVGRLSQQKGQWHLLRAFRQIKTQAPNSRLLLLGEGPEQAYLVDLSRRLGLKPWVHNRPNDGAPLDHDLLFLGFVENPFALLAHSKLFAFPSLWEGMGNVLLESLACGLPVLSADCHSGPREILAPDTSLLHQARQPEATPYGYLMPLCDGIRREAHFPLLQAEKYWADTIVDLLHDRPTLAAFSEKGPRRAEDFTIDSVIHRWRQVLRHGGG